MNQNAMIRLLFSVCLAAIGTLMVAIHSDTTAGTLVSHVGFAFVVAGVLSTFHEAVLNRFERGDLAKEIAQSVHTRLKEDPPTASGIRLAARVRKGYGGYYSWAIATGPADLFFAGRSVLHRIENDICKRTNRHAEEFLARRLEEGSRIQVLFLDPRSDLIPRLAKEENQTHKKLRSDLARSIGVCIRLHKLLEAKTLPPSAHLQICVFDKVPYFAYHRDGNQQIVGFYFSSAPGLESGAYDVLDPATKDFFSNHFDSILHSASENFVVRVNHGNGQTEINEQLIEQMLASLRAVIGDTATESAVARS